MKGKKTGGRVKGTPNRATVARQAEIAKSGLTPLDFMLKVMRNAKNSLEVRLEAAKSAAPYVHPKLASIDHTGKVDGTLTVQIVRFSDDNGSAAE
jgi:hypothetical protein